MKTTHRSILLLVVLLVMSVAAAVLADVYKWKWAGDWAAPLLSTLFVVSLVTVSSPPSKAPGARRSEAARWIRNAAIMVPTLCFLDVDIVGDAPLAMKFMGLKWTMSSYWATHLLGTGGLLIGMIVARLAWKESHPNGAKGADAGTPAAVS